MTANKKVWKMSWLVLYATFLSDELVDLRHFRDRDYREYFMHV